MYDPECLPLLLEVVKPRLDLWDETKIEEYGLVVATIEFPHAKKISQGTESEPVVAIGRWITTATVLSLDALQEPLDGDGKSVVSRFEGWLWDSLFEARGRCLHQSMTDIYGEPDYIISDLVNASSHAWGGMTSAVRQACIAPLPHYEVRKNSPIVTGFTCEGCARFARYHGNWNDWTWAKAEAAYLPTQFLHHVKSCEQGQMILRGERLRHDVESREIFELSLDSCRLWPTSEGHSTIPEHVTAAIGDLDSRVEHTPEEFYAVCKAIKQIMETREEQYKQAKEERQLADAMKRSEIEPKAKDKQMDRPGTIDRLRNLFLNNEMELVLR